MFTHQDVKKLCPAVTTERQALSWVQQANSFAAQHRIQSDMQPSEIRAKAIEHANETYELRKFQVPGQ